MKSKVVEKKEFRKFVDNLINSDFAVFGPTKKENPPAGQKTKYVFSEIGSYNDLVLQYNTTLLSPKKYFFPQKETLFKYKDNVPEEVIVEKKKIIFGVHPCDLHSLKLLDKAFLSENPDSNYLRNRDNTVIFGIDCKPDEFCFCKSMGTDSAVNTDYDLFFTDLGDKLVVDIGTTIGEEILKKHCKTEDVNELDKKSIEAQKCGKDSGFCQKLNMDLPQLSRLMEETYESKVWEEIGNICVSCGACVFACPTCYCFDVIDNQSLDLTAGERVRTWDGCVLQMFAAVGSGENFREKRSQRLRQRFYRKGKYLFDRFGEPGCVGCGRCGRSCIVEINPIKVFNGIEAYLKLEKYNKKTLPAVRQDIKAKK